MASKSMKLVSRLSNYVIQKGYFREVDIWNWVMPKEFS